MSYDEIYAQLKSQPPVPTPDHAPQPTDPRLGMYYAKARVVGSQVNYSVKASGVSVRGFLAGLFRG